MICSIKYKNKHKNYIILLKVTLLETNKINVRFHVKISLCNFFKLCRISGYDILIYL